MLTNNKLCPAHSAHGHLAPPIQPTTVEPRPFCLQWFIQDSQSEQGSFAYCSHRHSAEFCRVKKGDIKNWFRWVQSLRCCNRRDQRTTAELQNRFWVSAFSSVSQKIQTNPVSRASLPNRAAQIWNTKVWFRRSGCNYRSFRASVGLQGWQPSGLWLSDDSPLTLTVLK